MATSTPWVRGRSSTFESDHAAGAETCSGRLRESLATSIRISLLTEEAICLGGEEAMKKRFLSALGAFAVVVIAAGQAAKPSAPPAPGRPHTATASDADCGERICVAEPVKVKAVKPVYGVKCVEYCLPKCPHFCLLHPERCCPKCGKLRTRRVLVKRFVTEERDTVKCVPQRIATDR